MDTSETGISQIFDIKTQKQLTEHDLQWKKGVKKTIIFVFENNANVPLANLGYAIFFVAIGAVSVWVSLKISLMGAFITNKRVYAIIPQKAAIGGGLYFNGRLNSRVLKNIIRPGVASTAVRSQYHIKLYLLILSISTAFAALSIPEHAIDFVPMNWLYKMPTCRFLQVSRGVSMFLFTTVFVALQFVCLISIAQQTGNKFWKPIGFCKLLLGIASGIGIVFCVPWVMFWEPYVKGELKVQKIEVGRIPKGEVFRNATLFVVHKSGCRLSERVKENQLLELLLSFHYPFVWGCIVGLIQAYFFFRLFCSARRSVEGMSPITKAVIGIGILYFVCFSVAWSYKLVNSFKLVKPEAIANGHQKPGTLIFFIDKIVQNLAEIGTCFCPAFYSTILKNAVAAEKSEDDVNNNKNPASEDDTDKTVP